MKGWAIKTSTQSRPGSKYDILCNIPFSFPLANILKWRKKIKIFNTSGADK